MTPTQAWLVLACLGSTCLILHLSMLITDSSVQLMECLAVTDSLQIHLNDTERAIRVRGGLHTLMKESITKLEGKLAAQETRRQAKRAELQKLQQQLDELLKEAAQPAAAHTADLDALLAKQIKRTAMTRTNPARRGRTS